MALPDYTTQDNTTYKTNIDEEIAQARGNQASTAQGGTGTENGANTWAKLAEFVPTPAGNLAFKYHGVIVGEAFSGSVEFVINHYTSGTEWGGQVFIVNRADLDTTIPLNGIKLASNAAGNALGLWMKKTLVDRKYQLKEIAKTGEPEITYFTDAPWTATDPATGAGFVLTSAASEFATDVLEAHVGAIDIDIAGNATTADGVNAGGSVVLKTKVIEIGDWNMDITSTLSISLVGNGLSFANIRGAPSVLIRNDAGTILSDFNYNGADTSVYFSTSSLILVRGDAGFFDNTNYDSTGFNRGWVTVYYV